MNKKNREEKKGLDRTQIAVAIITVLGSAIVAFIGGYYSGANRVDSFPIVDNGASHTMSLDGINALVQSKNQALDERDQENGELRRTIGVLEEQLGKIGRADEERFAELERIIARNERELALKAIEIEELQERIRLYEAMARAEATVKPAVSPAPTNTLPPLPQETMEPSVAAKETPQEALAEEAGDAPTPIGHVVVTKVSGETANIRALPGSNYRNIRYARIGDEFPYTAIIHSSQTNTAWYEILLLDELDEEGKPRVAYIAASLVVDMSDLKGGTE